MTNKSIEAKQKAINNIFDAILYLEIIAAKHKLNEDKNVEELRNILARIGHYVEEI